MVGNISLEYLHSIDLISELALLPHLGLPVLRSGILQTSHAPKPGGYTDTYIVEIAAPVEVRKSRPTFC